MGKGTFISIIALMVAVVGAIVAFAAYFKYRNCILCNDLADDEMPDDDLSDLDYYATPVTDCSEEEIDEEPEASEPSMTDPSVIEMQEQRTTDEEF